MRNPQILSLSAPRPQSGKDTFAEQLALHFSRNRVATLAFGDYLRDCVSHLFGTNAQFIRELLDDSRKDLITPMCAGHNIVHADYREWMIQNGHSLTEPRAPRWHMQHFGNDYTKGHLGLTDFWVDVVDRRIAWLVKTKPNLKYIIVTDTRSPNEFQRLKNHGAEFIMIKRTGFNKDQHDDNVKRHPVETHADAWVYDMTIWNQYGHPDAMLDQFLTLNNM